MTNRLQPDAGAEGAREALMLAYYFRPADHAGTRRVSAFARYLPDLGYRPVVLTTNARGSLPSDAKDLVFRADELSGLLARPYRALLLRGVPEQQRANADAIPADSAVSRLMNAWMIPDIHVTWYPLAVRRALKLVRERPIRLIFSSSPPTTSHLVALRLKRITRLPWVADFRDGWMFEPPNPAPLSSPARARIEGLLERHVVAAADRIIVVNERIADDLRRRHPAARERVSVISNGYDPADFAGIAARHAPSQRLRIVHTGSLTLSRAQTSIAGLIAALRGLQAAQPELASDLELVLIGQLTVAEQAFIGDAGLGEMVRIVGPVFHRRALQYQADADVLLLVTVPGESSVTTSKLFEYLAVGRPILGLTGVSAAADLIRHLNAGIVVAPDDVAGIQAVLRDLHARWRSDGLPTRVDPLVADYSRPKLTRSLANLFDDLLAGARPAASDTSVRR